LTENAAIVRYAKYSFQQSPTQHGSQKPGQKYSFQLLNRTSLYWALWFEHNNCTNPDFNKLERQYRLKILQEIHFPFCVVGVNPLPPLRSLRACWMIHGVWTFMHWVLHKHQTSRKHSPHLTNRL